MPQPACESPGPRRTPPDGQLVAFLADHATQAQIDFRYLAHDFTVDDQYGAYNFFVDDPDCPDWILNEVVAHFAKLLSPAC